MNRLLQEVLTSHGGIERWQAVTAISAQGTFGGLLRSRFPGNGLATLDVRVQVERQRVVLNRFPNEGERGVFDNGDVRIETREGELMQARRNARTAFSGLSGLRRNLRWDALDATYFAGYALWNYLSTPLLLTRPDVTTVDAGTWWESGQHWRRIEVRFPPHVHTHSPRQTFYVDTAGLIRRHDYVAQPVGRWARAIHYCDRHKIVDGLVISTRRRVVPRAPWGRAFPYPVLVSLEIDEINVET